MKKRKSFLYAITPAPKSGAAVTIGAMLAVAALEATELAWLPATLAALVAADPTEAADEVARAAPEAILESCDEIEAAALPVAVEA